MDRRSAIKKSILTLGIIGSAPAAGKDLKIFNIGNSTKGYDERTQEIFDNATVRIPESRPFLEQIIKSNYDHRDIFDVPVEYNIALFRQESKFDSKALSYAGALGLGQMMRYTAEDLNMKVFDPVQFKDAYEHETYLMQNSKKLYSLKRAVDNNLRVNNFKNVQTYKLRKDKLLKEFHSKFKEAKTLYEALSGDDDDRLKPEKAVDFSVKHLARLCKKAYVFDFSKTRAEELRIREGHNNKTHAILFAICAYNSGNFAFDNEGIPFIEETVKYVRKIMKYSDMIYPGTDF